MGKDDMEYVDKNIDLKEYIDTYVNKSPSDTYVLFTINEYGDTVIIDSGSIDFCVERMKDIFSMSEVDNGMAIDSIEQCRANY
jgi:phosphoserine phosphatase